MRNTLQEQYNLLKEGKMNKQHFFKSARHLFPDLITPTNSFTDAVTILKNRGVISEGIGGLVTTGKKQDWHAIFNENMTTLKEEKEAKAEEKETTKEVTDMATRGYDYKDEKNYDNVFGQEFLQGYYTEMKDPKNADKHVEELRAIVAKNLAKDISYYVKDGQFGVKGLGYTTEAPGLGEPKEPKGKFKSSGYGDLKENRDPETETSFYNSLKVGDKVIYNGPEKNGFKKGDEVEVATYLSNSTFQKTITIKKGNKKLIVKGHGSLKPLNESNLVSLKESVLRLAIQDIIKEVIAEISKDEAIEAKKGDTVTYKQDGKEKTSKIAEMSLGAGDPLPTFKLENGDKINAKDVLKLNEALDMDAIKNEGEDAKKKVMGRRITNEIVKRKKQIKALETLTELEEESGDNTKKVKELQSEIKKLEGAKAKLDEKKKVKEIAYSGPGAADDLAKDPNLNKVKDKTSLINKVKQGGTVEI